MHHRITEPVIGFLVEVRGLRIPETGDVLGHPSHPRSRDGSQLDGVSSETERWCLPSTTGQVVLEVSGAAWEIARIINRGAHPADRPHNGSPSRGRRHRSSGSARTSNTVAIRPADRTWPASAIGT